MASLCMQQVIPYFTLARDQAAAAEAVQGDCHECKGDMSDEECAYVAAGRQLAPTLGEDSSPFSAGAYGLITGVALISQSPSGLAHRRSSRHLSRRALSKRSECLANSDRLASSSEAVERLPAIADCNGRSSRCGQDGLSESDLPGKFHGMQPMNIMSGSLRTIGLLGSPQEISQKGILFDRMRQALSKSSRVLVVALSK